MRRRKTWQEVMFDGLELIARAQSMKAAELAKLSPAERDAYELNERQSQAQAFEDIGMMTIAPGQAGSLN